MDIWGKIYQDHLAGRVGPYEVERDDGRVQTFASAASYFDVPRSDGERELLDLLEGPVLDLAAGPGSYALYLQGRGLNVTVADIS